MLEVTLFFDIIKLETEAQGNDLRFMQILEDYYYRIKHQKLQKIKYKSIAGNGWLLHPTPLFNRKLADIAYIVQYIKLAGRRDYLLFKFYNQITLDCSFYPNLDIERIKRNPLLTVSNNHIHFKYETLYLNSRKKYGT